MPSDFGDRRAHATIVAGLVGLGSALSVLSLQVIALLAALMLGIVASLVTSVSHEELLDANERFATAPCAGGNDSVLSNCDNSFWGETAPHAELFSLSGLGSHLPR